MRVFHLFRVPLREQDPATAGDFQAFGQAIGGAGDYADAFAQPIDCLMM